MSKERRSLIVFLLLAFAVPLLSVYLQERISDDIICFILFGIQAAAPTISAVLVLLIDRDIKALPQMFSKKHISKAVLLPLITVCASMIPAKLIFCALSGQSFRMGYIGTAQLIIILWALIAEETGWRGYLEPLLIKLGAGNASPLIVGIIWCLWHYHYFIQGRMDVPPAVFLAGCIIESYIYSLLMKATEYNIISAMSYHFLYNLMIHIALINPADNGGNTLPYILMTISEGIILLILLIQHRISRADKGEYNG